jgi:hypothetical protein
MSADNVIHVDPGPLARFREVIEDASTMGLIVQRVTDGETLKDIARAWSIPYGRLAEWIVEDRTRSEQFNQALAIWADSLAHESVQIADEGGAEAGEVQRDKLRIDTRLKLAGKLNRPRYGDSTEIKHTGTVSLIAVLSSLPRGRVLDALPESEPAGALAVPAGSAGTSLEKNPQVNESELI